jgi:hypothetical protein
VLNYKSTNDSAYLDKAQKTIDFVIFLNMKEYGKELTIFIETNK